MKTNEITNKNFLDLKLGERLVCVDNFNRKRFLTVEKTYKITDIRLSMNGYLMVEGCPVFLSVDRFRRITKKIG